MEIISRSKSVLSSSKYQVQQLNCMAKSILAALDSIDFHRSRDYGLCEEYGRAIVNRRKKNMTIILC